MRNKVRENRVKHGITQKGLAELIGVSRQSIIAIESGRYVPSTVLALKLSLTLKSGVEELFELEEGD